MSPAPLPCQGHPSPPRPRARTADSPAPEAAVAVVGEVAGVDAPGWGCGCGRLRVWMERLIRGPKTSLRRLGDGAPPSHGEPAALPCDSLTCGDEIDSSALLLRHRSGRGANSLSTTPNDHKSQYMSFLEEENIHRHI